MKGEGGRREGGRRRGEAWGDGMMRGGKGEEEG